MQHDVVTELFYDGDWNTARVYARGGIELSRGAGGEDDEAPPSTATLTFDNRDGSKNPRNPLSPLFGLAGRNTPLRVSMPTAQSSVSDTFTRTVVDDWGTATSGQTYALAGTSGTVFSNFDVTGTAGTMVVAAAAGYRAAWLENVSLLDYEAYAECTVAASTGGALEPTLLLRVAGPGDYYMIRANLPPASGIDLVVRKVVDGVATLLSTVSGVSAHTAANPIKIKARVVGITIWAKAWQGSTEPDWQVSVTDGALPLAGSVGLRAGRAAGNSNTNALFTFDNLSATPINVRGTVEVSSWQPGRDVSGNDQWTAIQGGGILRRLQQGDTPLRSVAYQAYMAPENDPYRVEYWPMEEESDATAILSPSGSNPIQFEDVQLGAYTSSPSSERMITLGDTGFLHATVRPYTSTVHSTHTLWTLPPEGLFDQAVMTRIVFTGGNVAFADLIYGLPNALTLRLYDATTATIGDSGPWGPFNIDGNHFLMVLRFVQNGANVDTTITAAFVDDSPWLQAPLTFNSRTIGRIYTVRTHSPGASVGHLAVGNNTAAFTNFTQAEGGVVGLKGFRGERAGRRFIRIAGEAGVPAAVYGDPDDTQILGPQPVASSSDILAESVRTDDAMMFEARNDRAVIMRTGRSRYNQDPALELDFDGGQISPGMAPALDDRHTRNDVTANRPGGSSFTAVRRTGPLNVSDPITDPEGVGRYETAVDVNPSDDADLVGQAYWRLHRGTVDEPRYPEVTVDLDRAPELQAAVDAVEIGDRITIANMPLDWQQSMGDLLVLGIRESFPPGTGGRRRTVTFVCIPASQFEIGVVGADDGFYDLRGQAVDTDNTTTTEALDTTETGVDITSTGGVVWTTRSDDWNTSLHGTCEFGGGLFIVIGGEVMRVTSITGAGPAQTINVVRSVNGVVKQHATGAAVHTWRPVRVGL